MKFNARSRYKLSKIIKSLSKGKDSMANVIGINLTLVLLKRISKEQYKQNMSSLKTKNKRLKHLLGSKVKNSNVNKFSVSVINLSSHVFNRKRKSHPKYALKCCSIDHNKIVKKRLSVDL